VEHEFYRLRVLLKEENKQVYFGIRKQQGGREIRGVNMMVVKMHGYYFSTKLSPHFMQAQDFSQAAYDSLYLACLFLPKITNQRILRTAREPRNAPAFIHQLRSGDTLNNITAWYAAHAEKIIPRKESSLPIAGLSGGEQRCASGVCEKCSVVYFAPPQPEASPFPWEVPS
jgi:hypothetical protein